MKITSILIIISFLISSCSTWTTGTTYKPQLSRLPASNVEEITYYLSVDKFKYYLNEYSAALEGKIPDEVTSYLKALTIKDILAMNLSTDELADAKIYDSLIYDLLKEQNLLGNVSEVQLKWNYNFFKTKLNEAFTLSPSKLNIDLSLVGSQLSNDLDKGLTLLPENLKAEEMTLDSGHYISNRTTSAIFWEATLNNRPIEFHLGDSREFLKKLKDQQGEILFEVKPLAKNYNKIYIIQYPGESTYRYAISNIGGQDRLDHLTHQISLSKLANEQKLKVKVMVKGDIKKFHAAKTEEHAQQLRLLPKADRVIIGQKEAIDGKFNLFWKVKALKNLYDENPTAFNLLSTKDQEKLFSVINENFEVLFKEKKIIEDTYTSLEKHFIKKPALLPVKFKQYNYDNFTIEMCDYVFETPEKKIVRWRVISNVWGDEVIPIAQALKKTGHTNVTYMGTAGAFAVKGYKVGDLVIPSAVRDHKALIPINSRAMKIEGSKIGGSVEHVGSPFEETQAWLAKAQAQSDFVEVETSYLARIFNGPNGPDANLQIYLLISDILGSESETLAHATSGKRKNAQNRLLAELFKRDLTGIPSPIKSLGENHQEIVKNLIFETLEKKSTAFRNYAHAHLKDKKGLRPIDIEKFAAAKSPFTDNYLIDRLVKIGELIHEVKKKNPNIGEFDIAVSRSLITGLWHPKEEKLNIIFKAKNSQSEILLKKTLTEKSDFLNSLKSFATFGVAMSGGDSSMVWMKTPDKIDVDFLVNIYALSAFKSTGLTKNVTYNGNITLNFLPTSKSENPLEAFYQGAGSPKAIPTESNCMEAMRALVQMI